MVDPSSVEFVTAHRQRLVEAATLTCGDPDLAEDLAQEALIKVAARWHRWSDQAPLAYARRIVYHDSISMWRRRRKEDSRASAEQPPNTRVGAGRRRIWLNCPPSATT